MGAVNSEEVVVSEEPFFGYQDIGEKGFIRWSLEYSMEPIIECYLAIPPDLRYGRPMERLSAPCRILGHIARNEESLLRGCAQGIAESAFAGSRAVFNLSQAMTEQQLREQIPDTSIGVDYWRQVRKQTLEFLDGLTGEDLRKRPVRSTLRQGDGNRDNPLREFFLMAIQHQNLHWGGLRVICRLLGVAVRW